MKLEYFCIIASVIALVFSFRIEQPLIGLSLSSIAQQLANNTYGNRYSMTTQEGYNMDCLKVLYRENNEKIGVFHSSKGQTDSYNRLYSAIQSSQNQRYTILSKLSQRGSQGTIFTSATINGAYIIAYQLQNHQHGNTFAIRYYQSFQHIGTNNFLYQYQLEQKIDNSRVRNMGTPSVQEIQVTKKQSDGRFSQLYVKVKFHYSPDGQHDFPGMGYVNFKPLRDFVDKSGKWVGGCKENYSDWKGSSDTNVLNAMRKIGVTGKIGQRDSFTIQSSGKTYRYYLYEANLYSDFDWKNWRIFLYGQTQNQVLPIPFILDKVYDLANPHITVQSQNQSQIVFQLSFFLPSEGMQPFSSATPGQAMVKSRIKL